MKRPFILITNDDGISAPGLRSLWQSVCSFADCAIVAPHSEKSGAGLSITWTKPLRIESISWQDETPAWSVSGTPADCVKMASHFLISKKPDMILSGINKGSNAGRTVLYSGTIGGVIEGVLKNIPGIAFSSCDFTFSSMSHAQKYIATLVQYFLKNPLPKGTLLNVNFPSNAVEIKGLKMTKQGQNYWMEDPEKRTHPEGIPYYWLGGKWSSIEEDPESDVALLEKGYITAVPIHVSQLTDFHSLTTMKNTIENLFKTSSKPTPFL